MKLDSNPFLSVSVDVKSQLTALEKMQVRCTWSSLLIPSKILRQVDAELILQSRRSPVSGGWSGDTCCTQIPQNRRDSLTLSQQISPVCGNAAPKYNTNSQEDRKVRR